MFVSAHDKKRLIMFSLHVGGPLTDEELQSILAAIDASADALSRAPKDVFATTVVVVESEAGPNASQRKRIGEASRKVGRSHQVLVTSSTVVRAIMTAIRWFSPASERGRQETFATYEEARAWLVARTGHSGEIFDGMLRDLRAEVRRRTAAGQT